MRLEKEQGRRGIVQGFVNHSKDFSFYSNMGAIGAFRVEERHGLTYFLTELLSVITN